MAGKPMISCEIGTGTSFVNLGGVTGLTIPPADPEKLAQALQRLWSNRHEAERFGQAARARYEAMFTAQRMVGAYVELYRAIGGDQGTANLVS